MGIFFTVTFIKPKTTGTNTEFPISEVLLEHYVMFLDGNFVVFEEFFFGRIF